MWGVVWGTPRWTNVALRQTAPIVIGGHDESSYGARTLRSRGIGDLQVVTSVPWIGVSNAKLPDTGIFLGRLAQIWPAFRGSLLQPDDSLEVEGFIRRWGIARAAWTSNTHRSLPMWMAGTFYLVQAVSGPELREGELRCALRSFASARAEFFNGGNVELEQAIMNNEAIATIFRGGIDVGVKQSKQQAIDLLMRATSKVGHAQGRGRPSATASSLFVNLQNLRGAHGSPAKRKKTL